MTVRRYPTIAATLGVATLAGVAWLSAGVQAQTHPRHAALAVAGIDHEIADAQARAAEDMAAALADADQEPNVTRMLSVLDGRGSRLGVSIRDVNDDEAKAGKTSGVVIEDVNDDSPAEKGGLKAGDIVTNFDGERVRSARQFSRLVEETPSGRSVKAQVSRNGSNVDLTLTPQAPEPMRMSGNMPQRFQMFRMPEGGQTFEWRSDEPSPRMPFGPGGPMARIAPELRDKIDMGMGMARGRLGIGVQDLTPELAEYFGVKEGVLVTSVQKDGAAAKAGVKAGDVITTVDGSSIDDAAELRQRVWKDGNAAEVALGISRDKKAQTLKVQLPDADEASGATSDKQKVEKIEKKVIKRKV